MRTNIALSQGLLGGLALALAGCTGAYYYQSGGYYPPPPPPPGRAPVVVAPVAVAPVMAAPEYVDPTTGAEVDVGMFYDSLAPHGRWVVVASYGRVFVPSGVRTGWRPYMQGHWEYTDFGLTWVSDEPFGWATYHYGGWEIVPGYGWVWVPGTRWGPAWVAWREGGGYCGWAPLPPHHGLEINVSITSGIPASHFTFVEERYVTAPRVHERVVNVERNTTIINRTTNITNVRVVNQKVVNQSLTVERVQKATGQRIQPKVLRTTDSPARGQVRGNEIDIYHPKVAPPKPAAKPNTVQPLTPPRPATAPPPPGGVMPPPGAVKPNPQYEAARQRLNAQHDKELKGLDAKHAKERQNRGSLTAAQLQKRQEAERQKIEAEHRQEVVALKKKYNVTGDGR